MHQINMWFPINLSFYFRILVYTTHMPPNSYCYCLRSLFLNKRYGFINTVLCSLICAFLEYQNVKLCQFPSPIFLEERVIFLLVFIYNFSLNVKSYIHTMCYRIHIVKKYFLSGNCPCNFSLQTLCHQIYAYRILLVGNQSISIK